MDIKMLIAIHKPYPVPEDGMYYPIHVGAEGKAERLGFPGDDTGENISRKNANYCELTGVYWAWKNLQAEYIGLSHYRRYFSLQRRGKSFDKVLTGRQAEELLADCDILLPKQRNYFVESNESHYLHAHHKEPWEEMCRIIRAEHPEYTAALDEMRNSKKGHRFNMFLMKRDVFDRYCGWLFPILQEIESRVDISGYDTKEARVFGYLAERMLDVWVRANELSYKELPVLFMEKQNWLKKGTAFLWRKIRAKQN